MESERTTRLVSISREAYRRMAENTDPGERAALLEQYRAASRRTQAATDLDYALEILESRAASVAQLRRRLHAATMRHADQGTEKTYNAKHKTAGELKAAIVLLSRAAYGLVKAEESDRLLYDMELEQTEPRDLIAVPVEQAGGPIARVSVAGVSYMEPCPGCELEQANAADPAHYCALCRMLADAAPLELEEQAS